MRSIFCAGLLLAAGPGVAQTAPAMPAPPPATAPASSLRTYALRLRPGQDLRQELLAFVEQQNLKAACVLTAVGSLTTTTLRLANQEGPSVYRGHFEIVSLVGTLAVSGSHLHLSVSDSTGRTIGGHLLDGNVVYTTVELVIGELPELEFSRETDSTFGYRELTIRPAAAAPTNTTSPVRPARRKK